ncbi:MAG: helix-turn-helix domain-containing protein [Marinilabiliaceae bacterium]|nr:helix-turn-helix domain-containing protein [Marinilabiliaceae bacterium]
MRNIITIVTLILLASSILQHSLSQNLFFEKITGQNVSIDAPVQGIAKDSIGYMWFCTWNGLFRYNGNSFKKYNHLSDDSLTISTTRFRNIITDENKQLWLLTFDNHYIKYNYSYDQFNVVNDSLISSTIKYLLSCTSDELNSKTIIDDIQYFIGENCFAGRNVLTGDTILYCPDMYQPGKLLENNFPCFYIDNQNIIWLGSRNGNIYKANTKRNPFYLEHIYSKKNMSPIIESIRTVINFNNEMWIGTHNSGVFIKNNDGVIKENIGFNKINNLSIRAFYSDSNNFLWIGTLNGLIKFDKNKQEYIKVISYEQQPKIFRHSTYSIRKYGKGKIIVGMYSGYAVVDKQTNEVSYYSLNQLIRNHIVMDVIEDDYNNIWLATEGSGVLKFAFNENGDIKDTLWFKGFGDINIYGQKQGKLAYCIYKDTAQDIWVGTSDGLFNIDNSTNRGVKLTKYNGLADDYITAITAGIKGDIWISHKKGISKIDHTNHKVFNYDILENNVSWVFNERSWYNDKQKNIIYFGSREGIASFNPDKIKPIWYSSKLVLSNIFISGHLVSPMEDINDDIVLNKVLPLTKKIELSYINRDFGFEINVLNYQSSNINHYLYILEGYNEEWVQTTFNRVTFFKIPPGNYLFKAKAVLLDGRESNEISVSVNVRNPWYLTIWAVIIYIVISICVIALIIHVRLSRKLLKRKVEASKIYAEKQEFINRERLDFFTNISHELRTPLSLIIDPIKQLKNNTLSTSRRIQYLNMISKNAEQLSHLINQILDFRKLDANKMLPNYSNQNAIAIIKDYLKPFELQALNRNISFVVQLKKIELSGYFDRKKLEQIVQNIVSNALKYTPDGGNIIVTVDSNKSDTKLILSVKDNGVGIESQALQKIFEPFNNEGTKPFFGYSSGIGLALTKKIVELLNGKITIKSDFNIGTLVIVEIPYCFDNMNDENFTETDDVKQCLLFNNENNIQNKSTVLIVEDNDDVLTFLNMELGEKFVVLSEKDGQMGLKSAIRYIPDVIVSDVMMPVMDGITFCKKIKNNEKTSHIPVILLTAKASDEDHIQGFKTGADVYMPKPFSVEVLKAQIVSIIENRRLLQNMLSKKTHISDLENNDNEIDNRFLRKTIKAIEKNIDVIGFSADQLADALKISQRQLYRKLKAITGNSIHEFILRVRLEHAAKLLVDSNLNISEIAYKVGFSESSNFSRTFSKHYGCSPTKYAKTHK